MIFRLQIFCFGSRLTVHRLVFLTGRKVKQEKQFFLHTSLYMRPTARGRQCPTLNFEERGTTAKPQRWLLEEVGARNMEHASSSAWRTIHQWYSGFWLPLLHLWLWFRIHAASHHSMPLRTNIMYGRCVTVTEGKVWNPWCCCDKCDMTQELATTTNPFLPTDRPSAKANSPLLFNFLCRRFKVASLRFGESNGCCSKGHRMMARDDDLPDFTGNLPLWGAWTFSARRRRTDVPFKEPLSPKQC